MVGETCEESQQGKQKKKDMEPMRSKREPIKWDIASRIVRAKESSM